MICTHDNIRRLLDFLTSRPRLSAAMRAIGGSEKLIFNWLKRSASGDPAFLVSWPKGDPPRPFHELVVEARKKSVVIFEAAMRSEVIEGIPRVVITDGEVQYQRDPRFIGWSDADMKAVGFDPSERFLRDRNGYAIPLVVMDSAPAHLKIHMLKSLVPSVYGEKKTLDVNSRINGRVMIIGAPPLTPVESKPVLEALPAIEDEDEEPALPEPMEEEPDLPEWTPVEALQQLPATPVAPPAARQAVDRIGAGEVVPGGFRIA